MSNLTYLTCEHCRQEFPFTDTDRYYQPMLVDLHLRLHLQICEDVDRMVVDLIAQTERHLSRRCPYVRLGGPGVKWRCVRYGCDGMHDMEREES